MPLIETIGSGSIKGYGIVAAYPITLPAVTSGLSLFFDPGQYSSYSGGTTWRDISGSASNATLFNDPIHTQSGNGSYFTFVNANSQYASVSGSRNVSSATFIVWLRRSGDQTSYAGLFFSRPGVGGALANGMNFRELTNTIGYTWNNEATTYTFVTALTPPNEAWCMCAVSVSPTSATAYLYQNSGITSATNTQSHVPVTLDALTIAADPFALARTFNGRIGQVMLYNRALTQTELSQNFNASRAGYGI
jgi:hypothetical protein